MTPYYQDDAVTIYNCRVEGWWNVTETKGWRLITDPPYGFNAYPTDKKPGVEVMFGLVAEHRTAAVFGYPEEMISWCVDFRLPPREWVTWWPTNPMRGRDKDLQRESEIIAIWGELPGADRVQVERSESAKRIAFVQSKLGKARAGDYRSAGDVWTDPKPGSGFSTHRKQHPNEKPLSLMERLVELCSDPGDTVFDPFMGSGTTLEAAKKRGRIAIGIEIEERYCEIAARRCAQEVLAVA